LKNEETPTLEKIILHKREKKEHYAIFTHAYFIWGLRLGLRLGLDNRLNKIILTKFLSLNEKKNKI